MQDQARQHVLQVVEQQNGNLRQSAQRLGISRTALYNKLNAWNVDCGKLRR